MDIISLKQPKCIRVLNNSPEISLGFTLQTSIWEPLVCNTAGAHMVRSVTDVAKKNVCCKYRIYFTNPSWLAPLHGGKTKCSFFKCFCGHVSVLLACVCHFNMYRVFLVSRRQKKSVVVPPSCGGSCKWVPVVVVAALLCQWCSSERLE